MNIMKDSGHLSQPVAFKNLQPALRFGFAKAEPRRGDIYVDSVTLQILRAASR